MENNNSNLGLAMDELEPPYDDLEHQPKTLTRNRHIHDRQILYVAGRAPVKDREQYDIMFVTTAVEEDEATQHSVTTFGYRINQPAEYLKGPTGLIKDIALRSGVDMDQSYYTAVCKWLLPRSKRSKPSVKTLKWGLPILMDEIKRVKPKIIVCLGKHAFDLLSDRKIGFKDAHGGWFWSTEAQAHLYLMYAPFMLVAKPELHEVFRVDFTEIKRKKDILDGADIGEIPWRFEVLRDEQSLRDWVAQMNDIPDDQWPGIKDASGRKLIGVDCEWHGRTHVNGKLRTIQFAWTESDAVVVEFRDDQNCFSFQLDAETEDHLLPIDDTPEAFECCKYREIGKLLGAFMNRPDIRYVGHHFSADSPWMEYWLGLNTYRRCALDTEFAQQAIDEASELGLERGIAMKYTNLGLYCLDLVLWKKDNPKLVGDGYGYIPSEILHPYGALDVITPLRAYPHLIRQMQAQQLVRYYDTILNPFVTDVFTSFAMTGLPMDELLMDELRLLFHYAKGQLEVKFRERMHREARLHIMDKLIEELPDTGMMLAVRVLKAPDLYAALDIVKPAVDLKNIPKWISLVTHLFESANFNIRSPDQMRRWLFDVEGLEPIKTTNQKSKGMPSMSWEKVLELPADRQRLYTPAVDKQTLQILSEQCNTVDELLNLNAVGNLCKAFLKEADVYVDEDGEETVEENGLHQWLARHDSRTGMGSRVHCNYSLTGSSRPRSWRPNVLNWPSYVNKRISRSVVNVIKESFEDGSLPPNLMKWVECDEKSLPSIRSCVTAPEGWVLTESDYKTAEMVGLGVISGDKDLIKILREPDPEWAVLKPGGLGPYVRVRYADPGENGIPLENQKAEYLMSVWKDGKCLGSVTEEDIARNADGSFKHRGYDIHWSIAERIYERPREEMVEKVQRNAGKVINFCVAKDELVLTKERGHVPIQDVSNDDLLWDGSEWVSHEGVVFSGERTVLFYEGLWATADHEVWTCAGKVQLRQAIAEGRRLERATIPDGSSEWGGSRRRQETVRRECVDTYDIVNAGPLNRFTCSGVLVSNSSAYGASPASLDRKIESDTGVKPEAGTGEKGLAAIKQRQPRATEFLEEMAEVPKTVGYYRAKSGRICHCVTHGAGSGVNYRTRNSIESALGRELRNYPMQESVGSTSARACILALSLYKTLGLRALPMTCLYDSLVTLCPLEERFVVGKIHQLVMSDLNTWTYDDAHGHRVLQYEIDNEFNYRWSTRPDEKQQTELNDPDWHPTPDKLKWILLRKNWDLLVS